MKRYLLLIIVAVAVLAVYLVLEAPLTEKLRNSPIDVDVDALEFVLADGSGSVFLKDPAAIDKLRRAYRWTNRHIYCCLLPDQVYARVYQVSNGARKPAEPVKVYSSVSVPSFNLAFRLLLQRYCMQLSGGS